MMRAVFGPFSFDLRTFELTRNDVGLRLEEKPARLLACLIERRGTIVTREELHVLLWPTGVNLDFDHGLNKAVNKLRAVLGDNSTNPVYIETLSRRGYRFVHRVELVAEPLPASEPRQAPASAAANASPLEVQHNSAPVNTGTIAAGTDDEPRQWKRQGAATLLFLSAMLAAVSLFLPAVWIPGHQSPAHSAGLKRIRMPAGLRLITEGDGTLALSPDGTRAAFAAAGEDRIPRLWLYDFRTAQAHELPGTEDGTMPFWSPDGARLGFFTVFNLKTIDLASYSIKTLAATSSPKGGTWSPKGVILYAAETRGPIFRIPADGGEAVAVTRIDSKLTLTTHRWPSFLSDGTHFVYLEADHNQPNAPGTVILASIDGAGSKALLKSDSNAIARGNNLTYYLNGRLLSVSLSADKLKPQAHQTLMATSVNCDHGSWYCSFDLNNSGLLYRPGNQTAESDRIEWFDEAGKKIRDMGRPGLYRSVALSPDGKTVAVACGDPNTHVCLFRQDGTMSKIGSSGLVTEAVWAPDSSAIAYQNHRSNSDFTLVIESVHRSRSSKDLIHSRLDYSPIAWHPSGKAILYERARLGGIYDLAILDLKSGDSTPFLSDLPSAPGLARFSPDGKWLAFNKEIDGAKQVFIASFPNPSVQFPLTTEGGCSAKWRGDGRAIYYLGPGDTFYSVPISPSSHGFRIGTPVKLFRPPIFYAPWNCDAFDVSSNGRRFLVNSVSDTSVQELFFQAN